MTTAVHVGKTVCIRYLSALRDRAGRREDVLELSDEATLRTVVAWLARKRELVLPDAHVMATLNGRGWGQLEQGLDTPLADGDVLALFPMLSGG